MKKLFKSIAVVAVVLISSSVFAQAKKEPQLVQMKIPFGNLERD
jgi:hypothetical protein